MQVEMFSFKENLKRMDNSANSGRRSTPYKGLSREFADYYRISPAKLSELIKLEARMERFFSDWVKAKKRPDSGNPAYKD